jgi:ABC-2 type transport system ATP-binding protein
MAAIVAEDVRRRYGETVALDGVSLSVDRGEVYGLVGPNGAGKTTLVRALTGTTDAEGRVTVLGERPEAVDRERIGLLPQDFAPAERLTPRELCGYYGGLYAERIPTDALLEPVGLSSAADTRYEHLSGGQKRRTCVAITLVNDPDVLFLDEPTTGIDPAGRRALWTVLESLADAGTTVLLTTHDMAEAARLSDRVCLLAEGRVLAADTPKALVDRYGGESVLRVEVETDAVPALEYETRLVDGALIVADVPATAVGEVVSALEAAGVAYDGLTWTEPDLEDVYMDLAGGRETGGETP